MVEVDCKDKHASVRWLNSELCWLSLSSVQTGVWSSCQLLFDKYTDVGHLSHLRGHPVKGGTVLLKVGDNFTSKASQKFFWLPHIWLTWGDMKQNTAQSSEHCTVCIIVSTGPVWRLNKCERVLNEISLITVACVTTVARLKLQKMQFGTFWGWKPRPDVDFLKRGQSAAEALKQTLFWAWKPPKMHIVGINFISFTALIYNALHVKGIEKGGFWHLIRGHGLFASCPPFNPPMNFQYNFLSSEGYSHGYNSELNWCTRIQKTSANCIIIINMCAENKDIIQ